MTCIVAIRGRDGKIYMGADSRVTYGRMVYTGAQSKVVKRGEFLFGNAGNVVDAQVLHHTATIPPVSEHQDPLEYMINTFLPEFRRALKETGRMEKISDLEYSNARFLVAFRGHIFDLGMDFDVFEGVGDVFSIGSGSPYALGSLESTSGLPVKQRIREALEVASKYDPGVAGPFEIIDEEGTTWKWRTGEEMKEVKE